MLSQNLHNQLEKLTLNATFRAVWCDGVWQTELSYLPTTVQCVANNLIVTALLAKPLHLILFNTKNTTVPLKITTPPNTNLTLIEEFRQTDSAQFQQNITIAPYSKLQVCQLLPPHSKLNLITNYQQNQQSELQLFPLNFCADELTEQLAIQFIAPDAICNVCGLNILKLQQKTQQQFSIEHRYPHCRSQIKIKNILDDFSYSDFRCHVLVPSEALKTEALVTNNNLLLAPNACARTAPQLEIYADDVVCNHGATVGQIADDALFYLASRGFDQQLARRILLRAFIDEVLMQVPTWQRANGTPLLEDIAHDFNLF